MTNSFSLETELIHIVKLVHFYITDYLNMIHFEGYKNAYFKAACISNIQKSAEGQRGRQASSTLLICHEACFVDSCIILSLEISSKASFL